MARDLGDPVRNEIAAELCRRELLVRGGVLGLGVLVLGATGVAGRIARPQTALAQAGSADGLLQAYFDTIIPGKQVPDLRTELGDPIDPRAIAGVDHEHGAVYTDALRLARHPKIGFGAIEPSFLADLNLRSLAEGGLFLDLDYEARERVCVAGLAFANPDRALWEAAAAVPFTAFCAAANHIEPTRRDAAGYRVMGHPGTAPTGYRDFSYRRRLNRGRTKGGSLP